MPGSNPRLTARTVFGRPRTDGMRSYLADYGASRYAFYGYGKLAMRDALDVLAAERPGATNVVLPAYLPHGIVESFRDAGLEPRYYRCDRRLRPDLGDVERLLDGGSLAAMLVHYFGHPQSPEDVESMRALCAEHGAFLIDDNAHAPLSTSEGRLLGTLGDVGITSLRKLLPIPNGALLFVTNDSLVDGRLARAGVRDRYTLDDYSYCARSLGRSVSGYPGIEEALSTIRWMRDRTARPRGVDQKVADGGEDPREIYEDAREPMSRLAWRVFDRTDPQRVIAARRANYRVWDRTIRDVDGAEPVFSELPDGVCPQYYTILVDDPNDLGPLTGISAPWPPLPHEVREDAQFETENYLATHLHTLPVHQKLNLKGLGPLTREQR